MADSFLEGKTREIVSILSRAPAHREPPEKAAETLDQRSTAAKALKILLVVALIGTMLPLALLNHLSPNFALAMVLALLLPGYRRQIGRRFAMIGCTLAVASLITGCTPLFSGPDRDILAFCKENSVESGDACRIGTARGFRVLGIQVRAADSLGAQAEGGITKPTGIEITRGSGLISVDVVRVYGS